MTCILEVALDAPLRSVFDYRAPADSQPRAGQRVRAPFGRRRLVGVIVAVKAKSELPPGKLKSVLEILDDAPTFERELFELLKWAGDYYRHPIGEVFAAAMPNALRQGETLDEQIERWTLTEQGEREWRTMPLRSTRLRALAQAIAANASLEQLADISPTWRAGLRELQARGWAQQQFIPNAPTPAHSTTATAGHALSEAQDAALTKITTAVGGESGITQFRSFLLQGVTGSGKTEVYLRAIERVVARGGQALVLAPEIALTPQLLARFQERFAAPIAVLHSALNDSERLQAWRAARSGDAAIVIGTRSAVFAPFAKLQLIIVDEEHDTSYKQQEGFRYSARDLAIVRAQRLSIPIVLGSATPSLESLARVKRQPDDLLPLPARAGGANAPTMRLIDLRVQARNEGLAMPALQAMRSHLDAGGQVLIYLNRRGFAPVLFCNACGWQAPCPRCDARATVHQRANKLMCHHCGHESALPSLCPQCSGPARPVGEGTERIETGLARLFPEHAIARIDRDNIRRRGELENTLAQIAARQVQILVGTQMLAKGHHFPDVSLVVIVNADQGLFGADFRAAERLAQSIVQVAGRAGRAERPGEVLIQSEYPEHPLLQSLLSGGYGAFAERALQEREQAQWPPFARLALLRAEASTLNAAMSFLESAKERVARQHHPAVELLGPVAAPMVRRAGRYRAQLLLRAATHAPLQKLLSQWLAQIETLPQAKRVRWSIDVDPAELF